MHPFLIFLLVCLGLGIGFAIVFCSIRTVKKNRVRFVVQHSLALKELMELKKRYPFHEIPDYDLCHSYDSEFSYNDISPEDYLIYELDRKKEKVLKAYEDAKANATILKAFEKEASAIKEFNRYDVEISQRKKVALAYIEEMFFEEIYPKPKIELKIKIRIELKRLDGIVRRSKSDSFNSSQILDLIERIEDKNGSYYEDYEIFQSLCRVERGKVTKLVRARVLARDHNRCVKCGSRYRLEIDHIIPISKGGKTTLDNLQTLCHDCNVAKGNKIE